jgi:hypothetical protein
MDINNNPLTEQQLDDLILQTFERQQIAEDITVGVMKDLRRQTRRRQLRQWGRAAAFAFGLPLVLLFFGWLLWLFVSQQGQNLIVYVCLVFPAAAMFYGSWKAVEFFYPIEV